MTINVDLWADWQPFNVSVVGGLLDEGFAVSFGVALGRRYFSVEVDEWRQFLSVLWRVWAGISRGSDFAWMMRAQYEVSVEVGGKAYNVGIRVTPNGLVYGSIAL